MWSLKITFCKARPAQYGSEKNMQLNTGLHTDCVGHMTVPWAFQSSHSWGSRSAADMVIIACISCYTVIRRHDQWWIFIIILNYADRWKSRVRVPTCDGWLNWTNDSPCSTAHSSVMPIREWYLVSEGPHHYQRISAPPPLPCTHLSMQHIIMTARLIYVELSLIQTLRWFFNYFFFCTADCVDMGSHVVRAHLCSLVFTRSSIACVHVCCVMRTDSTCMQKAGSKEQLGRLW